MTKKLLKPLDDPPTASSSEDEVESSGEEEEASSSEEEEPTDPVKSTSAAVTIAVPGKTTAGSETETDSDSEIEPASNPPNPGSGKASTAIDSKSKKKVSVALALPASKSVEKRQIEANSSDSKAKRVKIEKTGEESKKPAFQRLWTEEDEITVLQGMIDFKADTGKSPYEDSNGYYDFIKKSISFDVSKNQFMDKIRSLKKKYISKEKTSFTKPHDLKSLNLAKYIWGPEGMALESVLRSNGVSKKTPKTKKLDSVKQELPFTSPNGKDVEEEGDLEKSQDVKKSDWFENSFLIKSIASFGVDEEYVKQRWSLVEVENKKKIEEKYKELQGKEYEYVLQKTKFLHEVTSMIGDASKNK